MFNFFILVYICNIGRYNYNSTKTSQNTQKSLNSYSEGLSGSIRADRLNQETTNSPNLAVIRGALRRPPSSPKQLKPRRTAAERGQRTGDNRETSQEPNPVRGRAGQRHLPTLMIRLTADSDTTRKYWRSLRRRQGREGERKRGRERERAPCCNQ